MVCDAVAVTRRAETPAESSPSGESQPAVAAEPVAAADAEVGLSLEELAAQSGVVGRTIRFYQSERLLPKPRRDARDGRVARYGPEHVERLRLIGELRDRGLKLPAIRHLIEEGDASESVARWLGLDDTLRGAWTDTPPRLFTANELAELLTDAPPGTRGVLEEAGLLVRQGRAWLAPNPALLEVGVAIIGGGVEPELVIDAGTILHRHLAKAAAELVDMFLKSQEREDDGVDLDKLIRALRPVVGDAASIIFRSEIERSVGGVLAKPKRLPTVRKR